MSLRETASTIRQKPTGFPCGVTKLAAKLSDDDRTWLDEQLRNDDVTASWISSVLRADGHELSQAIVSRHKRGSCRCESV